MSAPSKPKTKSNLVLSRVTIDDVPDLCRAFNLSFTHPFNQHTFPWSADSEKWWHKFYANAILKDPQGTHVMKVVDTNTTGKLVAFARWVMPAGTGSGNLAEEDRWPKYSKDFDAGLCDVMFGTFDEMRKKHMGDRPHYCKHVNQNLPTISYIDVVPFSYRTAWNNIRICWPRRRVYACELRL